MDNNEKKIFINGVWHKTKEYTPLTSPYSGKVIAEIPVATEGEVNKAIEAAYEQRATMAKLPAHKRAGILENLVLLLQKRMDEATKIIALESAKPIKNAQDEVFRTIETYKFAAEEAKRIQGETIQMDAAKGGEKRIAYTLKEPIGVIGAITPFNFPMNLVAHKVGPAIASGNTLVLKPAAQTPLSAFFIAELLQEAGLPDGTLNVVTGNGRAIGHQIVTSCKVNMITFTGSPAVGKEIRNKAGLKRVTLELGSNAGVIIDRDVEIEKIISRCVVGAFSNQGQVCISLQRIYVHEDIYNQFVTKFIEATNQLKIGDPLRSDTDISALISKNDLARGLQWIREAEDEGAVIRTGGKAEGNILLPTVVLEATSRSKVSCNEVFAPIVIINSIKSVEEGIEFINDSKYGLQAGIYTNNIQIALEASEKLHVGGVIINDIPTYRVDHMPYGGVKESGFGREGLKYAIEEMTELKLVIWNRN